MGSDLFGNKWTHTYQMFYVTGWEIGLVKLYSRKILEQNQNTVELGIFRGCSL